MINNNVLSFIIKNIKQHPYDIISFTAEKLKISRQAVHKQIAKLIEHEQIKNNGSKRTPFYQLIDNFYQPNIAVLKVNKNRDEEKVWIDTVFPHLKHLSENTIKICHYGFTEMFNNVIDHSKATKAKIFVLVNKFIKIDIEDNGIGIFNKLKEYLKIDDEKEVILHLTKGKLTTDASTHTGQGIFFTSRIFDTFELCSGKTKYARHEKDDWLIETLSKGIKGTKVSLKIKKDSKKDVVSIFREYENDDFEFSSTEPMVELSLHKNEDYVSRSQAKRLLYNLDKFKTINLDFKNVKTIGQGFVDEIFRVFKKTHPNIKIHYKNANSDVEFMIKRNFTKKSTQQ